MNIANETIVLRQLKYFNEKEIKSVLPNIIREIRDSLIASEDPEGEVSDILESHLGGGKVGTSYKIKITLIIKSLGVKNVINASVNEIIDALVELKNSTILQPPKVKKAPPSRPPSSKETTTYRERLTTKPQEEADEEDEELDEEPTIEDIIEEFTEALDGFKTFEYKQGKHEERAKLTIRNYEILLNRIKTEKLDEKDLNDLVKDLNDYSSTLEELQSEIREDPKTTDKAVNKIKIEVAVPGDEDIEEDEKEEILDIEKRRSKRRSRLTKDEPFLRSIFGDVSTPFIYAEEQTIKLDINAVNLAYENTRKELIKFFEKINYIANVDQTPVPSNVKREFNEIIHSIKEKDQEGVAQIKKLTESLNTSNKDSIKIRNDFYTYGLLCERLSKDVELFDTIKVYFLYMVNKSLWQLAYGKKNLASTPSGIKDVSIADISRLFPTIIDEINAGGMAQLRSKFVLALSNFYTGFYEEEVGEYSSGVNDCIGEIFINSALVKRNAVKKVTRAGGTVSVKMGHCPVCYKRVPFSTPEAIKDKDDYRTFKVPLVSPFSREKGPITDDIMRFGFEGGNEVYKYPPPDASNYTREIDINSVKAYNGDLSWDEILTLLRSNNKKQHEEGWHRRSAAMLDDRIGGTFIKETDVKSSMYQCPYSKDNSSCGIVLDKISIQGRGFLPLPSDKMKFGLEEELWYAKDVVRRSIEELTVEVVAKAIGFVPEDVSYEDEWYDLKHKLMLLSKEVTLKASDVNFSYAADKIFSDKNGEIEERLEHIEDEGLREKTRIKASGGFKFSKSMFGCPCRIPSKDIDWVTMKRYVYTFPYSGPYSAENNTALPTKPDGSLDDSIEEGTFGFLTCGAKTSLSSLDLSSLDNDGIVKILKDLYASSLSEYQKFIAYLVENGLDLSDIMDLYSLVHGGKKVEASNKNINKIKYRTEKVSNLIKEAIVTSRDDQFELLKGIVLTCPFGHKFKIKDSLNFGNEHFSVSTKASRFKLKYFDMSNYSAESSGENSLDIMIKRGILVDLSRLNFKRNYMYYDEWVKQENKALNIKQVKKGVDFKDYAFLKFKFKDRDYIVSDSFVLRRSAWPSDSEAAYTHAGEEVAEVAGAFAQTFGPQTDDGGGITEGWETKGVSEDNEIRDDFDIRLIDIPGVNRDAISTLLENNESNYASKELVYDSVSSSAASLSRALKASLNIVKVWTRDLSTMDMVQGVLVDPEKINLDKVVLDIIESISDKITFVESENINGRIRAKEVRGGKLTSGYKKELSSMLKKKVEEAMIVFGPIKPGTDAVDSATRILSGSLMQLYENYNDYDKLSATLQRSPPARINLEEDAEEQEMDDIANKFIKSNKALRRYLTRTPLKVGVSLEKKVVATKLLLVSFACHTAKTINEIYTNYLDKSAEEYIGVDFGIDLSTFDKVINIDTQQINTIREDSFTEEDAEFLLKKYGGLNNEYLLHIIKNIVENINACYNSLSLGISFSSRIAISPENIELAKTIISNRLSQENDGNSEDFLKKLDETLPITTMKLSSKIPKVRSIFSVPGAARDGSIFDLESTVPLENEDGFVIGCYNPVINFDSRKLQVGMISTRPTQGGIWPPEEVGFGARGPYVGINIPFKAGNKDISKVDLNAVDLSILITIDDIPIDITFLFQRGISEKDMTLLSNIEEKIDAISQAYNKVARELGREFDGDHLNKKLNELSLKYHDKLKALYAKRNMLRLRTLTGSNSISKNIRLDHQDEQEMSEAIFKSRYGNPNFYAKHARKGVGGAKELIKQVKDLYAKLNKTKNPDQRDAINKAILSIVSKLKDKQSEAEEKTVSISLTDPITAYKLIMDERIRGVVLSKDPDKEEIIREKLKKFIMDTYGGWVVKEILEEKFLNGRTLTVDQLLTLKDADGSDIDPEILTKLNKLLMREPRFVNHIGQYYDIVPYNNADPNAGSYMSYFYDFFGRSDTAPPDENGVVSYNALYNYSEGAKGMGAGTAKYSKKGPAEEVSSTLMRARAAMMKYIKASAAGNINVKVSKLVENESKIISKISKRRLGAIGIIKSLDEGSPTPESIIKELKLK